MNFIFQIGRYFMMLGNVFSKPEKFGIYWRRFTEECMVIGLNSMGIVSVISVFMGAVITIQTAAMITSAWIPKYTVGFTTRQSTILEFSPTIISLILAGKVGSNIAGSIGTMKVTEQIDALEIMGVNSQGYLILPKIAAAIFIFPLLIIFSIGLSLFGGYVAIASTGILSEGVYIIGIKAFFEDFTITYALIKSVVFAFIITSVSSYFGYYTSGGALEVGRSSTKAVVYSSVIILIANLALTRWLLI